MSFVQVEPLIISKVILPSSLPLFHAGFTVAAQCQNDHDRYVFQVMSSHRSHLFYYQLLKLTIFTHNVNGIHKFVFVFTLSSILHVNFCDSVGDVFGFVLYNFLFFTLFDQNVFAKELVCFGKHVFEMVLFLF